MLGLIFLNQEFIPKVGIKHKRRREESALKRMRLHIAL